MYSTTHTHTHGSKLHNKEPRVTAALLFKWGHFYSYSPAHRKLTALYCRNISLKAMKSVNVSNMSKMSPDTSSLCCLQRKEINSSLFQCTCVPPCGLLQNNISYEQHNITDTWAAFSSGSTSVTSYMSNSLKVSMLKPGILSISCCSRYFSSRST